MSVEVDPEKSIQVNVAKIWSARICGTILCLAGLTGMAYGVIGAGWLVFIGFLILI